MFLNREAPLGSIACKGWPSVFQKTFFRKIINPYLQVSGFVPVPITMAKVSGFHVCSLNQFKALGNIFAFLGEENLLIPCFYLLGQTRARVSTRGDLTVRVRLKHFKKLPKEKCDFATSYIDHLGITQQHWMSKLQKYLGIEWVESLCIIHRLLYKNILFLLTEHTLTYGCTVFHLDIRWTCVRLFGQSREPSTLYLCKRLFSFLPVRSQLFFTGSLIFVCN